MSESSRFLSGLVGSPHGSGRVALTRPDPTRPVRSDPTRGKPWLFCARLDVAPTAEHVFLTLLAAKYYSAPSIPSPFSVLMEFHKIPSCLPPDLAV